MADANSRAVVTPGLKEASECHWGWLYVGTKDALVATGHFKIEWFSQDVKPGRRCFNQAIDGRQIQIERRSKFLYQASRLFTDAERDQHDAVQSQRKAVSEFNRALSCLPRSAEDYRAHQARRVQIEQMIFIELATADEVGQYRGGYSFDADSLAEIREAYEELVTKIAGARIVYSSEGRGRCIAGIRERFCAELQEDAGASAFVQSLRKLPGAEGE